MEQFCKPLELASPSNTAMNGEQLKTFLTSWIYCFQDNFLLKQQPFLRSLFPRVRIGIFIFFFCPQIKKSYVYKLNSVKLIHPNVFTYIKTSARRSNRCSCTLLDDGRPTNIQNKDDSIKSILFFSLEVKLITIRPWPCRGIWGQAKWFLDSVWVTLRTRRKTCRVQLCCTVRQRPRNKRTNIFHLKYFRRKVLIRFRLSDKFWGTETNMRARLNGLAHKWKRIRFLSNFDIISFGGAHSAPRTLRNVCFTTFAHLSASGELTQCHVMCCPVAA